MAAPQPDASQMCNPPFVYGLAASSTGKQAAAALGDGTVAMLNFTGAKGRVVLEQRLSGGHSAAVSQVLFPKYAKDALLVSAGNDSKICLWDLSGGSGSADIGGGGGGGRGSKGSGSTEGMEGGKTIAGHGDADADDDGGGDTTAPTVTVKHTAKINWLAAASTTALFVADTSAVISEYTMPP